MSEAIPPVRRALISVSDKRNLETFASRLAAAGVTLYSTGGTARTLRQAGLEVIDVAEYTQFREMMSGRVKTLHPKIFAGILARRDRDDDLAAMQEHGIESIELVVVNLYPFAETVAKPDTTLPEAIEQIDIGGPSLVRAAAKNHAFVSVVTDAGQYDAVADAIEQQGGTTLAQRRRLAAEAFQHTAQYDAAIVGYLDDAFDEADSASPCSSETAEAGSEVQFPQQISLHLNLQSSLRYGENPHQAAAVYRCGSGAGTLLSAKILHGKELSYNNLLDLDSAVTMVRSEPEPTVVVLKHNNPCGAATAAELPTAAAAAMAGDPLSAFGSVLGLNRIVDLATAEVFAAPNQFIEAIVAPGFTPEAFELLTTKPKWKANVRLLEIPDLAPASVSLQYRAVDGGFLVQQSDTARDDEQNWNLVTDQAPADSLLGDLRFGWSMVRQVKSNAIVLCGGGSLVGIGAGQMSRVDSVEISIRKAGERAKGAILASDAFFPFPDSVERAAEAGIAAVIQPGGSRKDDEVIAACNRLGIPMIFTGLRHFRH